MGRRCWWLPLHHFPVMCRRVDGCGSCGATWTCEASCHRWWKTTMFIVLTSCQSLLSLLPPLQQIRVKADNLGVETAGVKHSMNPFDEIAVEQVRCFLSHTLPCPGTPLFPFPFSLKSTGELLWGCSHLRGWWCSCSPSPIHRFGMHLRRLSE
jgi:hypothetical protein